MSAPSYVHGASSVPLLGETIGENLRRTVERHGDLAQAAAYNVLFLLFLPLLLVWGGCIWWSMLTGRPLPRVRLPRWSVHLLFALLLGFWIVRNLPFPPFTFLAPHTLGGG